MLCVVTATVMAIVCTGSEIQFIGWREVVCVCVCTVHVCQFHLEGRHSACVSWIGTP